MVHSVALQATHLVVFASLKLSSVLTDVKSADLALGFNNSLGNKGACKIAFKLGNTSLCFLTAHLHSGQNATEKRNLDWSFLEKNLIHNQDGSKSKSTITPVFCYDAIVLMGDLNYRLSGNKQTVFAAIAQN
jgi:endonuclease/exonuclease/phosphatase family metal-dependent hydrolase